MIIYRFFPHGSKKITDLVPLKTIDPNVKTWLMRYMIMHDQEPLDYAAYNDPGVAEQYIQENQNTIIKINLPDAHQRLRTYYSKLNLRMVLYPSTYSLRPVLLVHSEKNSSNLNDYEQNLGMVGVYWWSHAVIARDWYRYAEHDPALIPGQLTHDFLVYNRAWSGTREYRLKFAELLIDHDLVAYCKTKFAPFDKDEYYGNHRFINDNFKIVRTDLHEIFEPNTASADSSADYNSDDYNGTGIEIVLETLFDDQRIQLTEKSLRPIACGHAFILVSSAGSLQYLKSYGFETFGDYIDESYDAVEHAGQRLDCIVREMQRISRLSLDQKQHLYSALKKISARNKQRFFSKSWQRNIIQEFKHNLDTALAQQKKFTVDVSDIRMINPS